MPRSERGASPLGFRQQLLARLRNQAQQQGISAQRLQQRIAFERLLARLPTSGAWTLKGGFALELRYGWSFRATQDMDLRTVLDLPDALTSLQSALAETSVRDHFTFEVTGPPERMSGAPGGSLRIPIVARLAGIEFDRFHLDVASGDVLVETPDLLSGSALLAFAAISPIRFPAYPLPQQLAEKLHAYTLPRAEENTRVKDLVDLVAIASTESIAADRLIACLRATFQHRGTHDVPPALPIPPLSWSTSFSRLAAPFLTGPMAGLAGGGQVAARFWDPILSGACVAGRWAPVEQIWRSALCEAGPPGGHPHQSQQTK
jgi:predicted nucleotidyltransferase component of viral defense system